MENADPSTPEGLLGNLNHCKIQDWSEYNLKVHEIKDWSKHVIPEEDQSRYLLSGGGLRKEFILELNRMFGLTPKI